MMQCFRKRGSGQGLVEFALIAPLFFLMVFGMLEGGRLLWTYHTLNNATKEGARYTTVRGAGSNQPDAPANSASIKTHMLDVSSGLNASGLSVNLVLLDGDMQDRSQFRVETTYQHQFILTSIFGMSGITLTDSSTDMYWREPDDS